MKPEDVSPANPEPDDVRPILDDVEEELASAIEKFGKFNSAHEGYAVILEELDELWAEIKSKGSTYEKMRAEAIQVAAMAVRFIMDIVPPPDHVCSAPYPVVDGYATCTACGNILGKVFTHND